MRCFSVQIFTSKKLTKGLRIHDHNDQCFRNYNMIGITALASYLATSLLFKVFLQEDAYSCCAHQSVA